MQRGRRRSLSTGPKDRRTAGRSGKPVAFTSKWIRWETDSTWQGGGHSLLYTVEEPPIDMHSSYPDLRYLCEIPLLVPDMQQGLSIFIGFKECDITAWGAGSQALLLYLSGIYSRCYLVINESRQPL